MARKDITLNSSEIAKFLKSGDVRGAITPHAQRVLSAAIAGAPVDTGEYVDSIAIESVTTDRAVERIVARAPHSHVVEANTGNLARALGAG